MHIRFTKMQGAGNDFVVLDETRARLGLNAAQYRFLANRHFGVGADQILTVRPSPAPGLDFEYVIHNADGGEVEHCGNGARCFVRYVRDKGLTYKTTVRVKVQLGEIELTMNPDGRVTVDMGVPIFDWERVPFNPMGLISDQANGWPVFDLNLGVQGMAPSMARVGVVSMGNPHAVQRVEDVDTFPVLVQGPLIENHPAFPNRVNAGFMQIVSRKQIKLRVFERGVGETLACGTGACAAVVLGIRQGWLDNRVDVLAPGGVLTIEWAAQADSPVLMTGPATSVFEGEIDLPDTLS
ncbi:MAG: diaminopimelate epimerase [Limnohabitans sp.]|jgi:diaminopimelate epimerase|uniref:diaminopimelate epimerase n=1 Tax=Limnohabitans sp. TaxID=1907725 RepID=UPI0025F8F5E4|nr:diaminopimelate epimerase [Limnohabitans sp.]MCO4087865.1 diaminopimelate epimerase [Limnohabitans sp.]